MAKKNNTSVTVTETNAVPFTLFDVKSQAEVNSMIARVGKSGQAWFRLVQDTGLQGLAHAMLHNNVDALNDLMKTLNSQAKQVNARLFSQWVNEFSPWEYRKTKDGKSFSFRKGEGEYRIAEAMESMWNDKGVAAFVKAVFTLESFDARIDRMIKDIEKAIAEGRVDGNAEALKARVIALKALKSEAIQATDFVEAEDTGDKDDTSEAIAA